MPEEELSQEEIKQGIHKKLYDISLNLNQLRSLAHKNKDPDLKDTICGSLDKDKRVIDMILDEIDK